LRITPRSTLAVAAGVGYAILAAVLTWPLPLYLRTHLLGSPGGDTGVYVWNLWIFRHELLRHAHMPFSTGHVFAFSGGADFSLHNYTPVAGLLGMPFIDGLGVVGAFNLVLLLFVCSSGLATFLLARRLGLGPTAAWIAGAVFMASPVLTGRQTVHLSLVAAAPLPLFLWALLRTLESKRMRDAVATGLLVAVATYCDAYYGVYCALMGAFVLAWQFGSVSITRREGFSRAAVWFVDGLMAVAGVIVAWRLLNGGSDLVVGALRIKLQTLYNPVLVLLCLAAIRGWLTWRPAVGLHDPAGDFRRLARLGAVSVGVCLALLSPILVGLALRVVNGQLPGTEIFWRSSPRGVDLLAYLVPNPSHPWFGPSTAPWFIPNQPEAFPEFVASFSIAAFVVIAVAAWHRMLPRLWVAFTAFFALLSLGPFVYIGGHNTFVIGPWAFLRYVPVIGMARSPSRFAVVAALGLALLLAFALEALWRRRAGSRRAWTAALTAVLAFELLPAPRKLYSAAVPEVYNLIASASTREESGRLLELPTGIRDGTSSMGNFNPASTFFQTRHRRPLIGGYLSRVSRWRKRLNQHSPVLSAIFMLSEGRTPSDESIDAARAGRETFLRRSCVRFVVLDKHRASPELRAFAMDVLDLALLHEDASYELSEPKNPPPCDPPPRRKGGRVIP
jgi:hypothetical protein